MNKMQKVANKLQKAGQTVNKFADKVEKTSTKQTKPLKTRQKAPMPNSSRNNATVT